MPGHSACLVVRLASECGRKSTSGSGRGIPTLESDEIPLTMSAGDYIGHLSTISAYLELSAAHQEQVFRRIEQVLPETVDVAGDIIVHLARRH